MHLKNSTAAFSFFNYVFIGENLEEKDIVLRHELVHVRQKHSLDLLFFEILRVLFWYNPLIYIYQSKLRVLREYIADKETLKTQNKANYYQNLLTQIFDTKQVSFINTFSQKSLIKKRIVMLQKSKSNKLNLTKYLVLLPLLFLIVAYNGMIAQESPKSPSYQELYLEFINGMQNSEGKKSYKPMKE
ncbi:MAG: M56 family metallopeptidase [Flavobacteriaceae bacterium]|nr:M56 family metallopeptidase [Flavobacteriaceae bacterium]